MKRSIELYGRLREAGRGAAVEIEIPERATAGTTLKILRQALGAQGALLDGCVLATATAVLLPDDIIKEDRLAALPPVCGG